MFSTQNEGTPYRPLNSLFWARDSRMPIAVRNRYVSLFYVPEKVAESPMFPALQCNQSAMKAGFFLSFTAPVSRKLSDGRQSCQVVLTVLDSKHFMFLLSPARNSLENTEHRQWFEAGNALCLSYNFHGTISSLQHLAWTILKFPPRSIKKCPPGGKGAIGKVRKTNCSVKDSGQTGYLTSQPRKGALHGWRNHYFPPPKIETKCWKPVWNSIFIYLHLEKLWIRFKFFKIHMNDECWFDLNENPSWYMVGGGWLGSRS